MLFGEFVVDDDESFCKILAVPDKHTALIQLPQVAGKILLLFIIVLNIYVEKFKLMLYNYPDNAFSDPDPIVTN